MTAIATATPHTMSAPPWPLSSIWRKPWNLFLKLVWLAAVLFVTTKIYAGLYYVLTQTIPWVQHHWNMIPAANRHDIRNVGEGYAAGNTSQAVVWNHWKQKSFLTRLPYARQLDASTTRFEKALHLPQVDDNFTVRGTGLAAGVVMMALYAVPGYFLGKGLVALLHHVGFMHTALAAANVTIGAHAAVLHRELLNLQADWPTKVVGLFCALVFGRRAGRGVFDDLQAISVVRLEAFTQKHWKLIRWIGPAGYVGRYNEYRASVGLSLRTVSRAEKIGWSIIGISCLILAAVGEYVLLFIAHSK